MRFRSPFTLYEIYKWLAALLGLTALLVGAYLVNREVQRRREAEKMDGAKRGQKGIVKLDGESYGIKDEPARAVTWYRPVAVYGRVVPNPQATIEVRSPFAGTLRADPNAPWPTPGQTVKKGQLFGRVDIRVGPQERLDLQMKWNEARLKQQGAEEVVAIHEKRVERLHRAGSSDFLPRKELDEALVQLADARTQLHTAQAAVTLWEKALRTIEQRPNGPSAGWTEPLLAPAEGEVTELAARPGTAVEAGGLVVRVVDFGRPLVRLDLPPEVLTAGPPPQVELTPAPVSPPVLGVTSLSESAPRAAPLLARLVGPAPQVDVASQFAAYCYEVPPEAARAAKDGFAWRPGLFVKAAVRCAGERPQQAVSVPRSAVLFHLGRAWVYVTVGPGRYERCEVQLLGQEADRWILTGVAANDPVVWKQAQVLLSEEFRGDIDND
jgi:biotin carboxyl carrier protein